MVRVARLELAASWSQTRRPTNWATPGNNIQLAEVFCQLNHYTRLLRKLQSHSLSNRLSGGIHTIDEMRGIHPEGGAMAPPDQ